MHFVVNLYTSSIYDVWQIFFCSTGIMDCLVIGYTNKSSVQGNGAPMVLHSPLLLVNNVNKTEAAFFLMQAVLPHDFPFSQVN